MTEFLRLRVLRYVIGACCYWAAWTIAGCAAEAPIADTPIADTLIEDALVEDAPVEDQSGAAALAGPRTGHAVHAGADVDVVIGDATHAFHVVGRGRLGTATRVVSVRDARARGLLPAAAHDPQAVPLPARITPESSLIIGYPTRLLGRQVVLGGVLTRVSAPDEPDLGAYKLSYLPPLHVRASLVPGRGGDTLTFKGCQIECSDDSPEAVVLTIPVLGLSPDGRQIYLDIATLGQRLSVADLLGSDISGYTEVESRATFAEHSQNTLVFDVQSTMMSDRLPDARAPGSQDERDTPLRLTVRWYIKLSPFDPAFAAREPIPAFGYFTTIRGVQQHILRFSTGSALNRPPVKYYIKNVPPEYRDAFSAAFDDWNRIFRDLLGYDLLAYEHLDAGDPRSPTIVAGDVRYNVIEWDLDNLTTYGGIGPVVANQRTGEIFSGTVLIQGALLVRLYQDWFTASAQAAELRAAGNAAAAEQILVEHQRRFQAGRPVTQRRASMRLGQLPFEIPAEQPGLLDPLPAEFAVDTPPPLQTFDSFMRGFMRGTVAHEIGHNLGLEHNFAGSLSGNAVDIASHSVMEYVVRAQRHIVRVAEYDRQAIAYGYLGDIAPAPLPFCSRLTTPFQPYLSAECSSADRGPDPFGFLREGRVRRIVGMLIGRGLGAAPPAWGVPDVFEPFIAAVWGMAFYATSAQSTADTWVSFHGVPGRPAEPEAIREYVLAQIHGAICDPSIVAEIQAKFALDQDAGALATQNWIAAMELAKSILVPLGLTLAPCELFDQLPL